VFTVIKQSRPIYKVTLGANTNLKVGVFAPTAVRGGDLAYDLQTPSNTQLGILNLVSSTGSVDTVPIFGTGFTTVTSNGSAIIVSANSASVRLDGLADVVEGVSPANNATLVYNNVTDKYEVKEIGLDGGTF
jgi:hypothetical protein